ncbi:hypothetical protein NDU88_005811 [Pleurodeles waltl]|uniref:Uncharacterized protein n=1 Tax=Pleurodeles waltl TaxID=8319 RepID=A0AAV7UL75_PLEWA|nr:hypothetical protein NDU88_005811 [Pleurodeles waltl]
MWRCRWRCWRRCWWRCLRRSLDSSSGGWLSERAAGGGVLGGGVVGWLCERAAGGRVLGCGAGGWLSERAAGGGAGGWLCDGAAGGGVLSGGARGGLVRRAGVLSSQRSIPWQKVKREMQRNSDELLHSLSKEFPKAETLNSQKRRFGYLGRRIG